MGIKANAEKVLSGIDRLATAYEKAKGHSMPTVTITRAQFDAVEEAIKKEKIGAPRWTGKTYKDIQLNVQ